MVVLMNAFTGTNNIIFYDKRDFLSFDVRDHQPSPHDTLASRMTDTSELACGNGGNPTQSYSHKPR